MSVSQIHKRAVFSSREQANEARNILQNALLAKGFESTRIEKIIEIENTLLETKKAVIEELASLRMKNEASFEAALSKSFEAAEVIIKNYIEKIQYEVSAQTEEATAKIKDSVHDANAFLTMAKEVFRSVTSSIESLKNEFTKKMTFVETLRKQDILNEVESLIEKKIAEEESEADESEEEIKVSDIKGLQEKLDEIRRASVVYGSGMRGGGDTVSAGSGISIARDSNGRTVITNTSTGGFTELSATETPNGATTVFTFPAASAQPSYIVADGVTYKAISKVGTVYWTWNAGAKQATLTIPPTDDIYAIV